MRLELSRFGIDRFAIGGLLAVVVGVAATGWMVKDLHTRRSDGATAQNEFDKLNARVQGLPASAAKGEDPVKVAEKLRRYVSPAAAVPELLKELTVVAGESNLGDVAPTFEEKPVDPASPEGAILQSLGATKSIAITVTFKSEYADAARFLDAAALLPRPLSVKQVQLLREPPKVAGSVVFEGFLAN